MEMERCHFWLAQFRDKSQAIEYLRDADVYTDAPISQFAADQGKRFYDHDWVFVEFDEAGDLNSMLSTINAPSITRDAVLARVQGVGFDCNALVVADEGEFSDPVSAQGEGYQLAYLGCFPLWSK